MDKISFKTSFKKHLKDLSINGIIDNLPDMLKIPCNYLVEENEKEVFLIGAFGVISGLLPNIKAIYSGKLISPNLFVYILAGYGGGKGGLDYAKKLGEQVHQTKKEQTNTMALTYANEMEIYKKELKEFTKNKLENMIPPNKPIHPPTLMTYIPANNSKSGIYQLLEENNGKGIIFETEGDTLTDALKQDFGGFSDILRKSFHHEDLSLFRRMNDELIEVQNPQLSVVISSTFDQLKALIPSIENGLYSRFLFYKLQEEHKFYNVFDGKKNNYHDQFTKEGAKFKTMYDTLELKDSPVNFSLTKEQEQLFTTYFGKKKSKMVDESDIKMSGTANRLGIIAFRIMMILTSIRCYGQGIIGNDIVCIDVDFNTALRIVDRLEKHAKTVYDYIQKEPDKKSMAIDLYKTGKAPAEISRLLYGDDKHRGNIYKWINN